MFVPSRNLIKGMLADTIGVSGSGFPDNILQNVKIGLYTNTPQLTPDTVLTDLVEPVYTGYARQSGGAFQGPFRNQDGSYSILSGEVLFQMQNANTPTVLYGAFLVDAATGLSLIGTSQFDNPVILNIPDDGCAFVFEINLPINAIGGGADLV